MIGRLGRHAELEGKDKEESQIQAVWRSKKGNLKEPHLVWKDEDNNTHFHYRQKQ